MIVGVDAHKRTHTLVAADETGRKLGERTVAATSEGHLEAVEWAERWPERRFALEDCRHVTRTLESDLLRAGQAVVRVPARLMAGARRGGRERGKSDPIDALAVVRAALRSPTSQLPSWTAHPASCVCSPGLTFHSGRGSQYTSTAFRRLLESHQARQSLSRPRQCWDNAVAESFFAAFEYIEVFCNRTRIPSAVGFRSPADYGACTLKPKDLAASAV